ncbi:tape measure protein [Dolosicoccus paucivorans]|uniref:tape measure protein n=1 Tax=Dolosicoccus paucivorans TaxID=84521 RepID=UPI0008878887|nr:tape measure protein [Dolosicoccus paucivorans]SDI41246.1 tape measure domain-containing protein [Dolosicoccus paucivorans]
MQSYSVEAILTAVDRGFTSTMTSANRSLGDLIRSTTTSTQGMSNMTKSFMLGSLASKAISTGVRMISSSMGGAVRRFDTLQSASKVFESMKFSSQEAQGAVDFFAESLDGLPTGLDQAIRGTQSFAGVTQDLTKSSKAWDALNKAVLGFGGTAEEVDRATDQLTKSFAKGTVDGNAFQSMIANGLGPALQEMARRMGHNNIDELQEAFKEGTYDANDFMDALIDLAENGSDSLESLTDMAFAQTEGIGTAWMLVGSRVTQGLTSMIEGVESFLQKLNLPSIVQMLDKFSYGVRGAMRSAGKAIEELGETLKPLESQIKQFFDLSNVNPMALVTGFAQVVGAVMVADTAINAMAKGLNMWDQSKSVVTGAVDGIGESFYGLGRKIKDIPTMVKTSFDKFGASVNEFVGHLGQAFPIVGTATEKVKGQFDSLMTKGQQLKNSSISMTKGIVAPFNSLVEKGSHVMKAMDMISGAVGNTAMSFGSMGMKITTMTGKAVGQLAMMGLQSSVVGAVIGAALLGAGLAYQHFGHQIDTVAQLAITQGPQIISGLADGIISGIPSLMSAGAEVLALFAQAFVANFPVMVQKGVEIIQALNQGLMSNMGSLLSSAFQIISTFVTSIASAIPQLIISGMQLILSLVQGVMSAVPNLLAQGHQVVPRFIQGVVSTISSIIAVGAQIIMTLINGVMTNLPQILSLGVQAVTGFIQGAMQVVFQLMQVGMRIITTLVQGITANLGNIIAAAGQIIAQLIRALATAIPQFISMGAQFIASLVVGLWNNRGSILEGIRSLVSDISSALLEGLSGLGEEVISALVAPFGKAGEWILEKMGLTKMGLKQETEEIKLNTQTDFQEAAQGADDAFANMTAEEIMAMTMANLGIETSEGTNNILQELGRVPEGSDFFAQFGEQAMFNMDQFGIGATDSSGQTAQSILDNMSRVPEGVPYFDELTNGANAAIAGMQGTIPPDVLAIADGVNASGQQVAQSSMHYDQLSSQAQASVSNMSSQVTSSFQQQGSQVQSTTQTMGQNVSTNFSQMATQTSQKMTQMNSDVKSKFTTMQQTAQTSMQQIVSNTASSMSQLQSNVSSTMSAVVSNIRSSMSSAVSAMNSAAGQAASAGRNMGMGFYNGLSSMSGAIIGLARSIANSAAAAMRSALSIHSPSRVTHKMGEQTGEGYYDGLDDWKRPVTRMATGLANSAIDGLSTVQDDLSGLLRGGLINSQHRLTINRNESPAPSFNIELNIGGYEFKRFTSRITQVQESEARIQGAYGGAY